MSNEVRDANEYTPDIEEQIIEWYGENVIPVLPPIDGVPDGAVLGVEDEKLVYFESLFDGETTASGNVAHIATASASENVKSLIVNITPLQSGTGDPSPSNVRPLSGWAGITITKWRKNMIGTLIADGKVPSISTGELVNANGIRSDYIPINPNTHYSFKYSGTFYGTYSTYLFFYDRNKNYISYEYAQAVDEISCKSPNNAVYTMVRIGNVTDLSRVDWAQLEISQTPTEYEAVAKNNYNVSWDSVSENVYGGTFSAITGELIVTHGLIASYSGETINGPWLSDRDVYVSGTTPTMGAQVVYPLTTPLTYQVDPITIPQSAEINNFTANNVGDLTVICLTSGGIKISENVSNALLECLEHVAWADDEGQYYYNALESALGS